MDEKKMSEIWDDCPLCGKGLIQHKYESIINFYCPSDRWEKSHYCVEFVQTVEGTNYLINTLWVVINNLESNFEIKYSHNYTSITDLETLRQLSRSYSIRPLESIKQYLRDLEKEKQSLIKENASPLI